jgi:cellobiose-specific phosphotransferase system component IIA
MAKISEKTESVCMEIISCAGEGRSKLLEAVDAFKAGEKEKAETLCQEADALLLKAHNIQFTELMKPQAAGEDVEINLLLLHAMDLLMISSCEKDWVQRLLH